MGERVVVALTATVLVVGSNRRQADVHEQLASIFAETTYEEIEIRWPALFFGFRRCVYLIWTRSGIAFRDTSDKACTEFIG